MRWTIERLKNARESEDRVNGETEWNEICPKRGAKRCPAGDASA